MINKEELQFVRDTQEVYNEFTVTAISNKINEFQDEFQDIQIKLSFDYHISAVDSSYNALKKLTVNTAEIDEVRRCLTMDKNPTGFSVTKRVPDINEIKDVRPDFILYYLDMVKSGIKAVANGTMPHEKKKKVMTYKKVVNSDTMKNIVTCSQNFYRLNYEGDIKLLAQVDNSLQTVVNADYINYTIIPFISKFSDTIKGIDKTIVQFRGVMDAVRIQYNDLNTYYRSELKAHNDIYTRRSLSTFFMNCSQCLFQIITFVTYMIMRKIDTVRSLTTCYEEIGRDYVEYVKFAYPASEVLATEDTVVGAVAPMYDNGTQFLEANTAEIHRITENILNFYRSYEPFTRVERLFTVDKDPAKTLIDPYRGKKEMMYATYDTATIKGVDIFNDIDQELDEFEQSMTDPFTLPSEIVSNSGLSVNFTDEYKDILRDISSVDKYNTSTVNYSRSLIFMIFKELMEFETNVRQAMLCAQKTYMHMTDIHGRIIKNDNMEFQSDRNRADLATFMNNLLDSYTAFCGKVYTVYVDRLNKLNSIMEAMHTDVVADQDAYYSMTESIDAYCPMADLDMIDFMEAMEESDANTQERIAELVTEAKKLILMKERGDLFTEGMIEDMEARVKKDNAEEEKKKKAEERKRKREEAKQARDAKNKKNAQEKKETDEAEQKALEEQDKKDAAAENKDGDAENKDGGTEENKDAENKDGGTEENKDAENKDAEEDKKTEGLFNKFKNWIIEFFSRLKDKQTPTKEEAQRIENAIDPPPPTPEAEKGPDMLEFILSPEANIARRKIVNFTIHGYSGPTALGDNAKGVPFETVKADIDRFVKNIQHSDKVFNIITEVKIGNKEPDILKEVWAELGIDAELITPDNQGMSSKDILTDSMYRHYAYGGLSQAKGANITINKGTAEKRDFFTKELVPYLKKYADSELPDWIPNSAVAESICNRMKQSYEIRLKQANLLKEKNQNGVKVLVAKDKNTANKQEEFSRLTQVYQNMLLAVFNAFSSILQSRTKSYKVLLDKTKAIYDQVQEKKAKGGTTEPKSKTKKKPDATEQTTEEPESTDGGEK